MRTTDRRGAALAAPSPAAGRLRAALLARLGGPGGCYNLGNALGLAVGIGLQASQASGGVAGAAGATLAFLAGDASAVALTLATAVFFWSGEVYYRAWAHGAPPDAALNRRGDLLSGVGAIGLGIGLMTLGQPLLAAFSGLLHAAGKFGSAFHRTPGAGLRGWPAAWPDPFRSAVLASRVPAMLAALLDLQAGLAGGASPAALAPPLTLLVCYLLWAKADLMLFAPTRP